MDRDHLLSAFPKVVLKRREDLGLSQEELADRSGLNRSYISDLERGERSISLRNLMRLSTALQLSLSSLIRMAEAHDETMPDIFSLAVDSLPAGIFFIDTKYNIKYFNQRAEEILGRPVVNTTLEDWHKTYPAYLTDAITPFPMEKRPLMRALKGEVVSDVEVFVPRPDGKDGAWLSITAGPVKNAGGKIIGAVSVIININERKRTEAFAKIES